MEGARRGDTPVGRFLKVRSFYSFDAFEQEKRPELLDVFASLAR
jgi:hypothetical protein